MESFPHGNKFEAAGGDPGQLESHTDSAGAARSKENSVEISRGEARQARSQIDGRLASVATRAETQFVQLLLNGGNHARVRKAHLVYIVAVEIKVTPALNIFDPGALG